MTDFGGLVAALDERSNLYDELITRELQIIWEHSFQNVPPSAGDGITDKFFDYSAGVTRSGPNVSIPEGEYLQTKERGDYGAGQPVIAGAAGHFTQEPSGDQDSYLGYYERDLGIGYGLGYKYFDGTGPASSAGAQPYAFDERGGEGREVVPQENWNLNKLNGEDGEGPEFDPTDGFTFRGPHACYGHTAAVVAVGVKKDTTADLATNGGLRRVSDAFEVYPVHVFNSPGETMWDEFDLPIAFETTGTQGDGFAFEATACHYEGETGRDNKRTNGNTWTPVKNGGSTLSLAAYPDWTYVMGFRKKAAWTTADVNPLAFSFNADQNCEVMLMRGGTLSNTDYQAPPESGDSEAATEYDLGATDSKANPTAIDSLGEQEWLDVVPGDKQTPVDISQDLGNIELTGQEPLSLLARPATSNQTNVSYAAMRNGGGF